MGNVRGKNVTWEPEFGQEHRLGTVQHILHKVGTLATKHYGLLAALGHPLDLQGASWILP